MFKKIKIIFLVVVLLMCFVGCGSKEDTKQIFLSSFNMYIPESWEIDESLADLDTMAFYTDFSDDSVYYMLFLSVNTSSYKITSSDLVSKLERVISKDEFTDVSDVVSKDLDGMIGYYIEYKQSDAKGDKYYRDYAFATGDEMIEMSFTTNKKDFSKIEKVVDTLKADNFD